MPDLVSGLVDALLEVFCDATGRRLLKLFGWRRPHRIASLFTGVAFWIIMNWIAYAAFSR